jgi:hypothetical protein
MYSVRCPICQHLLKVKREYHQAKFKCNHCQGLFTGSTEVITESAGTGGDAAGAAPAGKAASGKPAAPRKAPETVALGPEPAPSPPMDKGPAHAPPSAVYGRHPIGTRKKSSFGPIIGIVVMVLVAAPIVALIYHFNTHTHVAGEGWVPNDELQKRLAADKAKREGTDVAATQTAATDTPRAAKNSDNPGAAPADSGSGDSGEKPIQQGERYESGEFAQPKTNGDKKITVMETKDIPNDIDPSAGDIVGTVHNGYDRPLRSIQLTIQICDGNNKVVARASTAIEWVPAQATMPFSVKRKVPMDDKKVVAYATAEVADESTMSWVIPAEEYRWEKKEQTTEVVFSGKTKNETKAFLKDVEVTADFFTKEGIYLGTVNGPLREEEAAKGLGPGKLGHFSLIYDAKEGGSGTDIVQKAVARIRGNR